MNNSSDSLSVTLSDCPLEASHDTLHFIIGRLGTAVAGLGVVNNLLCVAVWCRRPMNRCLAAVFFVALGLSDTVCLLTGMVRSTRVLSYQRDMASATKASCRIVLFLQYTSQYISSWLLAAFNLQLCLQARRPLGRRPDRSTAVLNVLTLSVMMVLVNYFHLFVQPHVHTQVVFNTSGVECRAMYRDCRGSLPLVGPLNEGAWSLFNLTVGCLLPFVLLASASSYFAYVVMTKRADMMRLHMEEEDVTLHPLPGRVVTVIVIVNVAFIALTLPRDVYLVYYYHHPDDVSATASRVRHGLAVLGYTNNALNCVLYCLSSDTFRSKIWELLKDAGKCWCDFWYDPSSLDFLAETTDEERKTPHTASSSRRRDPRRQRAKHDLHDDYLDVEQQEEEEEEGSTTIILKERQQELEAALQTLEEERRVSQSRTGTGSAVIVKSFVNDSQAPNT